MSDHESRPGSADLDVDMKDQTVVAQSEEEHIDDAGSNADAREANSRLEEEAKQYLARQTKPVIVPSYAQWFDINTIHDIEKRSLPEFFPPLSDNSKLKSPEIYLEFRNFMIHTYRLNPIEYLTVTAARRNLAGDVASISRVHGFLQTWGLINYQIDPRTKSSLTGPQYTGHFQISVDTPRGLSPLIPKNATVIKGKDTPSTTPSVTEPKTPQDLEGNEIPYNLEIRRNVYDSTQDAITLKGEDKFTSTVIGTKYFFCNSCGNDSTTTRYHNLKAKSNICSKCFEQGQFPASFQSCDFVNLEKIATTSDASAWTDQEVLLLLEAIELYDDDWNRICGHVGSRTKEQCISKFIQLPIEDRYLNQQLHKKKQFYSEKLIGSSEGTLKGPREPVVETVSNTIAHLIKTVDPDLAANTLSKAISGIDKGTEDEDIARAAKLAIGTMAGEAYLKQKETLLQQEGLVKQVVELELKKIELKLNKLSIVEKTLDLEKKSLAKQKSDLLIDRISLRKQVLKVQSKLKKASELGATDEGLQLCEEALVEASRAPRVVVVGNNVTDNEKLKADANIGNGDVDVIDESSQPISLQFPQVYKYWSL
ncbi:RSC chromatin remodeling complex component [Komagataella phaffii CBS 7435]|uniref:Component of the RSC chromatin remodeling complex n=2 Tax=Komagataella phaffii TaxID=460519 RepID=C4R4V6_KOMPG|nr:Component of the RSC chromatin remodeling complex [Komagataella phaffii GS115]AOA63956.1 GQ67_03617T0 [Komagataella phaffii]CAH2449644.1 RSC chromatin remodeling complex component [Komagataella phaffii CBS 7435]CAY70592.1 Component of the RSC chromatin remodeling complex [Komagataella phaffii GS115]SCV12233.1 RSC chromatin remodeling complex component [Komagataella phaffii CBS 7435]